MEAFCALKLRVLATSRWETVYTDARFTLEPYQVVASATEVRAAVELLKGLKALASVRIQKVVTSR